MERRSPSVAQPCSWAHFSQNQAWGPGSLGDSGQSAVVTWVIPPGKSGSLRNSCLTRPKGPTAHELSCIPRGLDVAHSLPH